jgi:hypothetical protein
VFEFIRTALAALPAAATSGKALAAYAIAIAAWVIISFRVSRNRNLLKNLEKLPERDRLKALTIEMGSVPLKEGASAEQFLRARIHSYYFWAFLILCAVAVLIFLIASLTPVVMTDAFGDALALNDLKRYQNAEAQRIEETEKKIESVRIGMSKDLLLQEFGSPIQTLTVGGLQRLAWEVPMFWLLVDFSEGEATDIVFTSRDKRLRPHLKFLVDSPRLGEVTFARLDFGTPIFATLGSKFGQYVERCDASPSNATDGHYLYLSYSSMGVEYAETYNSSLFSVEEELSAGKPGKATAEARKEMIPNSIAFHSERMDDPENCNCWGSIWGMDYDDPIFPKK